MKKSIINFMILTLILGCLSGCSNNSSIISEIGTWYFETITDSDGSNYTIYPKSDYYNELKCDSNMLICEFDNDNTFKIKRSDKMSWSGKYTKKNLKDAISLSLEFNDGTTASAVCGKRKYYDGSSVNSLFLNVNEKYISFLDKI